MACWVGSPISQSEVKWEKCVQEREESRYLRLWGWLAGQGECHIFVFTSCPQVLITVGTEHVNQIKYLCSPCTVVKTGSVSCSLLALYTYLPVLPALLCVGSFLPLLPAVAYLMSMSSVFGTLRACPQDQGMLLKYVFPHLHQDSLPSLPGSICLRTQGRAMGAEV